MLVLLMTPAVTGLVLAGTHLYKPPFGSMVADLVINGDPDKLAQLEPGSKEQVHGAGN